MKKITIFILTSVLAAASLSMFIAGEGGLMLLMTRLGLIAFFCIASLAVERYLDSVKLKYAGCMPADIRIRDTVMKVRHLRREIKSVEVETMLEPVLPCSLKDVSVCFSSTLDEQTYSFYGSVGLLDDGTKVRLKSDDYTETLLPEADDFKLLGGVMHMECEFTTASGERMKKVYRLKHNNEYRNIKLPENIQENIDKYILVDLYYDSWMMIVSQDSEDTRMTIGE